jgi:hypothetical protein
MKARIAIGSRVNARDSADATERNARFLTELARQSFTKGLPPFERSARQPPGSRIGSPNEDPAAIGNARRCGNTDDRAAQKMAGGLAEEL